MAQLPYVTSETETIEIEVSVSIRFKNGWDSKEVASARRSVTATLSTSQIEGRVRDNLDNVALELDKQLGLTLTHISKARAAENAKKDAAKSQG